MITRVHPWGSRDILSFQVTHPEHVPDGHLLCYIATSLLEPNLLFSLYEEHCLDEIITLSYLLHVLITVMPDTSCCLEAGDSHQITDIFRNSKLIFSRALSIMTYINWRG